MLDSAIDTAKLLGVIENLGEAMLIEKFGDDLEAIGSSVKADMENEAFRRGVLLGMTSVLRCGGLPAFLSGPEAMNIVIKLAALAKFSEGAKA